MEVTNHLLTLRILGMISQESIWAWRWSKVYRYPQRKLRWLSGWSPNFILISYSIWMFPKMGVPPILSSFNRVFYYKPFILGYPFFWKHPYSGCLCIVMLVFRGCIRNMPRAEASKDHYQALDETLKVLTTSFPICISHLLQTLLVL